MRSIDINKSLIEGYMRLLENLSPGTKLDLIARLSHSIKTETTGTHKRFYKSFGAWKSKKSAEQIISEIRNSRTFSRQIEKF